MNLKLFLKNAKMKKEAKKKIFVSSIKSITIDDSEKGFCQTFSQNQKFYILDFETTGLDTEKDDIIETGIRVLEIKNGKVIKDEDYFHKMSFAESNPVEDINRISVDMLKDCKKFDEDEEIKRVMYGVLTDCMDSMQNTWLCGQYLPFEKKFIERFYGNIIPVDKIRMIDTWSIERVINPAYSHSQANIAKRRKIKIDYSKNHRSSYDIMITKEILLSQRKELYKKYFKEK